MTSLASAVTEFDYVIARPAGGRVTCIETAGSSVVALDRTQERPLPSGFMLLDTFLEHFEADEAIQEHLPQARVDLASEMEASGVITLRLLRLRKGMSQKDLAVVLGTSQAAVSQYESRERKPGEEALRALSSALEVDFNTLMDALQNG